MNSQEVVHSVLHEEAELAKASASQERTEWTLMRMHHWPGQAVLLWTRRAINNNPSEILLPRSLSGSFGTNRKPRAKCNLRPKGRGPRRRDHIRLPALDPLELEKTAVDRMDRVKSCFAVSTPGPSERLQVPHASFRAPRLRIFSSVRRIESKKHALSLLYSMEISSVELKQFFR